MNKLPILLAVGLLLGGCATPQQGAIPVVDAGAPWSELEEGSAAPAYTAADTLPPQTLPQDSGVVVMVPPGAVSAPLQTSSAPITSSVVDGPAGVVPPALPPALANAPVYSAPSGVPGSSSVLAADEQLDGPVLALLTGAAQQQGNGDLAGAAASLERAQRIAPREPQVLYRLAEVRLAQGDAAQAEQLARRGLTYASGRTAMQAGFWDVIARARQQLGDAAGAAQARERARATF